MPIPYKIAVLIYVFSDTGKMLLLHRKKPPNKDLYSPVGGKLEQHLGESPYACALRETYEEIGIQLTLDDIRLLGMVSEKAYSPPPSPLDNLPRDPNDLTHWLMFCFEVTRPLDVSLRTFDEGRLEWIDPIAIPDLSIPQTDRAILWPLVQQHSHMLNPANRKHDTSFSVHIDCTDPANLIATYEHPRQQPVILRTE